MMINVGDIVLVGFVTGTQRAEVLSCLQTDPPSVVVSPLRGGSTRILPVDELRMTDHRVEHTRRRKPCMCGGESVEIGTLGTPTPVLYCYSCRSIHDVPIKPVSPKSKSKPTKTSSSKPKRRTRK